MIDDKIKAYVVNYTNTSQAKGGFTSDGSPMPSIAFYIPDEEVFVDRGDNHPSGPIEIMYGVTRGDDAEPAYIKLLEETGVEPRQMMLNEGIAIWATALAVVKQPDKEVIDVLHGR